MDLHCRSKGQFSQGWRILFLEDYHVIFLFLLDTTKTHRFEYTRVWWYIGKTKVQKKETG